MRLPAAALSFAIALSCFAHQAAAQALAVHQAVSPPAASANAAAPAKPSTIIPGSPLATLTGAAPPPAAAPDDGESASPFGTENIGISISSALTKEAAGTVTTFTDAIQKSTRLTPIGDWLQGFGGDASRRAHAGDAAAGLALAFLPGVAADLLFGFGLRRPLAALARRAEARERQAEAEAAEAPPPDDDVAPGMPEDPLATPAENGATEAETGRPSGRRVSIIAWFRKFGFALLHFLLRLLPVLGFAATVGILLNTGLITTRQAKASIIGVSNAYLAARLAMEFLRFLLGPGTASLALISLAGTQIAWLLHWARILLVSGCAGFAVVTVCEILGLADDGAHALERLIVLIVHIELAVMIWQSRKGVARWIRGKDRPGAVSTLRRRLAAVWVFVALFYILALWVAWAAGVPYASGVLLRVVTVFIAATVLGRLAWFGSAQLLERMFPESRASSARQKRFFARVRAYNPALRVLFQSLIGFATIVFMLQGWGVQALPWLLRDPFSRALLYAILAIIITIAFAFILWEIANGLLNSRIDRLMSTNRTRQALRLRTLLPILRATLGGAIGLLAGLICLSKIGVNAAPLLAGAGVVGIAIGFGSQKLVQDIITGLFLLLEDAMQVGDVITLAGMTGTVERLSIRTIRLRGGDGSVNIIPFSAVTTVTNMTRDFGYAQISIQVDYEEDLTHVYAVLTDIGRTMRAEPAWGAMMRDDLQLFGLDQFGPSALVITGQIRTGPGQHWAVRREFYARVKQRFEEENIEIPYTYLPPPPKPPPRALTAEPAPAQITEARPPGPGGGRAGA